MLEPDNTEYLLVLAEAEYRMGDEEEAELLYKRILELDPTMMEAWLDWSYVLFNRGSVEEAVTMVYEALKTEPDCHQYHYRLVSYLYHLGKTKQAIEHLEMGLLLNFDDHFLLFEVSPVFSRIPEILETIERNRPN
jgi:tetratricopeptide (TPR) repeat protein